MQHLPVVCSTLSAAHLGLFIQQQYQFSSATSCRLLRAAIAHTYLITDGDNKYVFRLYNVNWRTQTEIAEEIKLLQLLHQNGIPVSYAIPDATRNYIITVPAPEGQRYGVLFSYAKGEKILSYSDEMHTAIGEIMARMHALTHNLQLQRVHYTPQVLLIDSFNLVKQFISIETAEMQFMQKTQEYVLQQYHAANETALRQGIVHLDIWFDNMNIYNKSEVTIFDFDFCGNGWLLHDIAYYTLQLFNTEREPEEYQRKLNCFLKGYESVTQITDEEKRLIPAASMAIYFFYLGVQCNRFESWTSTFLNETYLKRYINLVVKRLYDHYQLPA